jgi:hypothetical protein
MTAHTCDRCRRIIGEGEVGYRLSIKVYADFDGVINLDSRKVDLKEEFRKIRAYPERLLEEEVFKEFYFYLCPRCREIFCANPLNLGLENIKIPDSLPPADE